MKNKICFIILFIILFIAILTIRVEAASLNLTSSSTNVKVGGTVTITVKANNAAGMYRVTVSDSSILALSSGDMSEFLDNSSKQITFKAKKAGTVKVIAIPYDMTDNDNSTKAVTGSKTITIKVTNVNTTTTSKKNNSSTTNQNTTTTSKTTKATKPKKEETKQEEEPPQQEKYLLQSLTIEGEELLPEFNSEVYEYTVKVADKEQLNISAKANQDNLIVDIVGNENLQYGENTVTISVKGQDDKEVTTYKLTIMKEKSELTLANERIQELEQLNNTLKTVIIALIILVILICIVSALKIRKYKNGRN